MQRPCGKKQMGTRKEVKETSIAGVWRACAEEQNKSRVRDGDKIYSQRAEGQRTELNYVPSI